MDQLGDALFQRLVAGMLPQGGLERHNTMYTGAARARVVPRLPFLLLCTRLARHMAQGNDDNELLENGRVQIDECLTEGVIVFFVCIFC